MSTSTITKSRRNLARIANTTFENVNRKSLPQHIPTQRICELIMDAAAFVLLRMADGDPEKIHQARYRAPDRHQFRPAVKRIQNIFNADRISRDQAEAIAKSLLGVIAEATPGQLQSIKTELTGVAAG